ncbi:Obg-like ATPase [Allomyces arbusculus]|nr:Obg-like ATPase [Allomyces arbusculus]
MPPKKQQAAPEKILLGRPSNNLKIGVVGLPNTGKSLFFNVLTNSNVLSANYPFATIDPSEGRVAVPDTRFDELCAMYKPASKVPAYLTVLDIAGLVKGASSGAGLGNAFLSHIRAVDGIFHMLRCFIDPDIAHVEDEVDPVRDMEIIHEELRLKDEEFLIKKVDDLGKLAARAGQGADAKTKKEDYEIAKKVLDWVQVQKKDVRTGDWTSREVELLNTMHLLTAKPVIYLANLSEKDYIRKKNKFLPKVKAWIDANNRGDLLIPFSGALEEKLMTMDEAQRTEYLKSLGEGVQSALPKIIVAGYQALQLVYFFTAGADEVRAWTVRKQSKAPQAAGVIHTDFERGFIMADVMKFADLKELGSEAAVKAAGKYAQRGREYIVEDGDICHFKFNVTTQPKKK